jgi:hypothetical protein
MTPICLGFPSFSSHSGMFLFRFVTSPSGAASSFKTRRLPTAHSCYSSLLPYLYFANTTLFSYFSLCYCWFSLNSHIWSSFVRAARFVCNLLYWIFFGLLLYFEDGSTTFLRNVGEILLDYMTHIPEGIGTGRLKSTVLVLVRSRSQLA